MSLTAGETEVVNSRLTVAHVRELEYLIRSEFDAFRKLYKSQYGDDAMCDRRHGPTVSDTIWTCYINGHGKGLSVAGWPGVFRSWLSRYAELGIDRQSAIQADGGCQIQPESWYHVDQMVVDFSDGTWWDGKYRHILAFEQENDPDEIRGHTRALFDLAVPNKVLLIWTTYTSEGPDELLKRAAAVQTWCADNNVPNVGYLWILVGNWPLLVRQLNDPKLPSEPFLRIHEAPSTLRGFQPAPSDIT